MQAYNWQKNISLRKGDSALLVMMTAYLRVCLVSPRKRKKTVNALKWKGILLIWSTKWNLFTKLFVWMGCKSRDESNEPI